MNKEKTNFVPISEKALLTVAEAAELTNIGQNKIRQIIAEPYCNFVVMVGNKRLIKRTIFLDWINTRRVL